MKKSLFIVALLLCAVTVNSQNTFNTQNELVKAVEVPNTPEAAAFTKYGDISANHYTGTPNISIPIYTFKGREINLPISLTYDASGIKVAQLASQAGLGWNLNVGGRVSRTVNGLPDDYLSSSNSYQTINSTSFVVLNGVTTTKKVPDFISDYLNPPSTFTSLQAAKDYFYFLKEVSDNKIDTQPDFFSFNALGHSNNFVNEIGTSAFKPLDNPNTKASVFYDSPNSIRDWTITTDDGTIFYFTQAEKAHVETDDLNANALLVREYNSSWLLTKIVSANTKDTYEFFYTDLGLSNTEPLLVNGSATNTLGGTEAQVTGSGRLVKNNTEYTISQSILTKIEYNGRPIVKINYKTRSDFNLNSAIDNIEIIKLEDSLSTVKKIKFNHSYFGNSSSQDSFDKRLKLDSLQETSSANIALKTYSFDYFSPSNVPSRNSLSRDYLGFYNGISNSVLYPSKNLGAFTLSGANRNSVYSTTIYGTLKKVTYPTGGFTEYEYEAHRSVENQGTVSDVTYGTLTVVGGTGSSSSCGTCCLDQYGTTPIINTVLFNIAEAGNYKILYERTGMDGEAYLLKRSYKQNYATPHDYDDIIDQSNCNELVQIKWSNFIGSNDDIVYLNTGTYQITIAKPPTPGNTSAYTKLQVWREESTGPIDVDRAGIRVKSIKSYEKTGVVSLEKQYKYTTTYANSVSSGKRLFVPDFSKTTLTQVLEGTTISDKQVLSRPTSWSSGGTAHVAYERVYEIQKKGALNDGYIEHNFNAGIENGITTNGEANYYSNEYKNGKTSVTNIFDIDNNLIKKDTTEYVNPVFFGKSTLYIHNNPLNTHNYVRIYTPSAGQFDIYYEPAIYTIINGSQVGVGKPSICNSSGSFCFDILNYSTLGTRQTYAQGKKGNVSSTKSYDYYNGGGTRTISNSYTYDLTIGYLLREQESTDSRGISTKTKMYYPSDVTSVSSLGHNDLTTIEKTGIDKLVLKNRLTSPIQTETYRSNVLHSTQRTNFKDWGSGRTMPTSIQTIKGLYNSSTNTLDDRIVFHSYYLSGNLKEVSQKNGTHIFYIWGYFDTQPIAKIENLTSAQFTAIQTLVSAAITASNSDVDLSTENALRTALKNIRDNSNLSSAMVTTYTYDPIIGVTSITDPRGKTIYYHYDDFNRLEFVKDDDGKILSNNQYNYKN